MEIWNQIPIDLYKNAGFGQTYSVSNFGNVRNNKTGRVLKQRPTKDGYPRANLGGKDYKVHRLVAMLFVDNLKPDEFDMINHIDGVKTNNHYSNLEWCNNALNQQHAYKLGLKQRLSGELNPMYGKPCSEERKENISKARKGKPLYEKRQKVKVVFTDNREVIFDSIDNVAEYFQISQSTVSHWLRGRNKPSYKYEISGIQKHKED